MPRKPVDARGQVLALDTPSGAHRKAPALTRGPKVHEKGDDSRDSVPTTEPLKGPRQRRAASATSGICRSDNVQGYRAHQYKDTVDQLHPWTRTMWQLKHVTKSYFV